MEHRRVAIGQFSGFPRLRQDGLLIAQYSEVLAADKKIGIIQGDSGYGGTGINGR
jgi:hypothetical protein